MRALWQPVAPESRPGAGGPPVEPLPPTRRHEAGDMLARALADDPLLTHVVPHPGRRTRVLLAQIGRSLIGYGLRFGEVFATDPLAGIAIWLPPERPPAALFGPARTLLLTLSLDVDAAGAGRFLRAWRSLERSHHRAVPEPHWHLALLGVVPRRRGQGLEEALLAPLLARADAAGLPCALTSLQAKAVIRFAPLGFAVVADGDLPDNGPHFWTMRRDPTP